jgi:hypothetical protein
VTALDCNELHFLLDRQGAIIAFQEKEQSWAGALAFSSEERAREFIQSSNLEVAELATVEVANQATLAALITALKKRPIRYLLLDLDYRSGACRQIEFESDGLGRVIEHRFTIPTQR